MHKCIIYVILESKKEKKLNLSVPMKERIHKNKKTT